MEYEAFGQDDAGEDGLDRDGADDSGTGAAIALIVALLAFVVAVAFIILHNLLFHV